MKVYETQQQFVLIEEGVTPPDKYKTYHIRFTSDMSNSYVEDFPSVNLKIKTWGSYGWGNHMAFLYSGLLFLPNFVGDREIFVLNFLNRLKVGNPKTIIYELVKETYGEEKYEKLKNILDNHCIVASEYLKLINTQNDFEKHINIENDLKEKVRILELENNSFKSRFEKIKGIIEN